MGARKKKSKARKAATATEPRVNKTQFVLNLPEQMSARDVVEEGKKQGITLSEKYVYVIRSNARKPGAAVGVGRGRGRAAAAGAPSRAAAGPLEAQLRSAIAELGLARARQVFKDVESAFGSR